METASFDRFTLLSSLRRVMFRRKISSLVKSEKMEEEGGEAKWSRETVEMVMKIVSPKLPQRDLISLLLLTPWLHRALISNLSLWTVIDLREMNNAGDRLIAALSLSRYRHVKQINLEFAQDVEDKHLELVKSKCSDSLQNLESLNLNGCQKISDKGIEAITSVCPQLKVFSIYWNVRVTDTSVKHLVKNCRRIIDLNLSGCKNVTDRSLQHVADNYQNLESLNITRCIKLTDGGLQQILFKCSFLQSLNLYALSSFTDEAYKKISLLPHLRFLDLCGAQNISDQGLSCIAKCKHLVSLNLTWCVRATDEGIIAIAQGCTSLEFLSLFGIVGVTDKCLEALSRSCSQTLTTLDVNGCIGIKTPKHIHETLQKILPFVETKPRRTTSIVPILEVFQSAQLIPTLTKPSWHLGCEHLCSSLGPHAKGRRRIHQLNRSDSLHVTHLDDKELLTYVLRLCTK